jgi:hypothetical protein
VATVLSTRLAGTFCSLRFFLDFLSVGRGISSIGVTAADIAFSDMKKKKFFSVKFIEENLTRDLHNG